MTLKFASVWDYRDDTIVDESERFLDAEALRFPGLRLLVPVRRLSGQRKRYEHIAAQRIYHRRAYANREDHSSTVANAEASSTEEHDVTNKEKSHDATVAQQLRFHLLRPTPAEFELQSVGTFRQEGGEEGVPDVIVG